MTTLFIRAILTIVSPSGRNGRLSILIFHRILPQPDPLFPHEPDAVRFEQICANLKAWYNVLPLAEAINRLRAATLPARAASITFDDGYGDNYRYALPILQRHDLHATFFIATGFLDGGRMWNDTLIEAIRATEHDMIDLKALGLGKIPTRSLADKQKAIGKIVPAVKRYALLKREDAVEQVADLCGNNPLPDNLMLTVTELRALHAAGMAIGAHTVSHPILTRCDEATARREIADGRDQLEDLLKDRVSLFAYPNGKLGADYTPEHALIVRHLGFDAAVSTNPGASGHGDDLFQLSRFTPWDRQTWRFGLRLAQNLTRAPVA